MTCGHCVKAVTTELKKLDHFKRVKVDVVPDGVSTVVVTSSAVITPEQAGHAIEEAGYQVVGVS
jgi:copper chaperone CopZ